MSIPLIFDTYIETRRLFIAGSELAVNDFRLERILPQMKKSGETVPIFARIADAIEKTLKSEKNKSSENLLDLANLVTAVLYTQSKTGIEGEIKDIGTAGLIAKTNISFGTLIPVVEALTQKGNGRLEILRDAYEEGVFKDLRLILPLIDALDDTYSDIAELASQILTDYGKAIVPLLKKQLSFDGNKGHARRLDIISKLAGCEEKNFYLEAFEKGSPAVRLSAIKALKDSPESENLLLELSKNKKKEIREAALLALTNFDSSSSTDRIIEAFSGKDKEISVIPIKQHKSLEIANYLLSEAEKCLDIVLKSEVTFKLLRKKADPPSEEVVEQFLLLLYCLEGKKLPSVFDFLEKCFDHSSHLNTITGYSDFGPDEEISLAKAVAHNILCFGTKEAYSLLDSARDKFGNCLIEYSFEASLTFFDPEYVYENYSKYLKPGKKSSLTTTIISVMHRYISFSEKYNLFEFSEENDDEFKKSDVKWDLRWINALIGIDNTLLVCKMLYKNEPSYIGYLLNKLNADLKMGEKVVCITLGLMQAGYPKLMDEIIKILEFNIKRAAICTNYCFDWFMDVLELLPCENAKELDELAGRYNNEAGSRIFEVARYLRGKKD